MPFEIRRNEVINRIENKYILNSWGCPHAFHHDTLEKSQINHARWAQISAIYLPIHIAWAENVGRQTLIEETWHIKETSGDFTNNASALLRWYQSEVQNTN